MGSRISVGSTADIFALTHCKWICNPPVDLNCVYCVCMLLGQHMRSCICLVIYCFCFPTSYAIFSKARAFLTNYCKENIRCSFGQCLPPAVNKYYPVSPFTCTKYTIPGCSDVPWYLSGFRTEKSSDTTTNQLICY